jgi:PAS domain S-box-containing protein
MVVGVLVIAGWLAGVPALRSFGAPALRSFGTGLASMKPNTAMCSVLAGVALALESRGPAAGRRRWLARAATGLVLLVCTLTLVEYATGHVIVDELLADDPYGEIGAPGRMSPLTLAAFFCIGAAFLLLDRPTGWTSQVLSTLGAFVGLLALVGYTLGAEAFYGIGDFTLVGVHTAFTLVLLGTGQLAARPDRGLPAVIVSDTVAGFTARRLVPAAILVPTAVGFTTERSHQLGWLAHESSVAVAVLLTILMFLLVIASSARSLYALDRERERMDVDLRASESKFRAVAESAREAIISADADGIITYVNPGATRMFDYAVADAVGRPLAELVPTRTRATTQSRRDEAAAPTVERAGVRRGGEEFPIELSLTRYGADGETHFTAIIRDVSERQLAERERRQLAAIVASSADAIYSTGLDGRIMSWNRAAERIFGWSAAEIVGLEAAVLVPSSRSSEGSGIHERVALGERVDLPETLRTRKDGSTVEVWLSVSPVEDAAGQVVGASAIVRDLTERNQAAREREAEQKLHEQKLRDALAEKEVLLKEIHHRVKNNLQVISSLLNFQSRQVRDPAALAAFRESQDRVRTMALFHEKLYQAKDLAHVELADYLRQMASMLRQTHGLGAARVALDVRAEGVSVGVDTAMPCGLIANELVTNALKYAFPGGRPGHIAIEVTPRAQGGFVLAVADDGVGLAPDLDILKSPSLGLQLVVAMVEQMNAELRVERGGGTRFEITVPPEPAPARPEARA